MRERKIISRLNVDSYSGPIGIMVTVHKGMLIVESVQNQGFCSLKKLLRKSLWSVEGGVETTWIYPDYLEVVSMVGNLHYLMGVVSTSIPGWIKTVSTKFFLLLNLFTLILVATVPYRRAV